MLNPSPPVPAVGTAVSGGGAVALVRGVGQSPNCSALAKRPWATTAGDSAGGVGGAAQCRVGHQVLCHLS